MIKTLRHDWALHVFLIAGLLLSALPLVFMLLISVKSPGQVITDPLGVTTPFHFENYVVAFRALARSLVNSIFIAAIDVTGVLVVACLAAYAFARFRFKGRSVLFWLVICVLFVPSILTFAPKYALVTQLGLTDTYWVLILPYIAGSVIFEIFVLRGFFASVSREIIEAAEIDGAGRMTVLVRIVIPLARPILATLAVLRVIDVWNEWLWPLVTVTKSEIRPLALQVLYLRTDVGDDLGRQMAGYVIASVPLLVLFILMSRQFERGLSSGAVKW